MRRRYKSGTGIGVIVFVVLLLFGIIAYRKIDLEKQSKLAAIKMENLEMQIKQQEDRAKEIKDLEAYVQTKRYIEDIAREKLGLVYKDEIILKPEEK